MIDESMDTEAMKEEPKPWEFRSKPAWQRLIIMLGGVTVNFIVAYLIYVFASAFYGDTSIATESVKDGYWIENPVLKDIGMQTGDKITAIDGKSYDTFIDLKKNLIVADEVTIEREGVSQTIELPEDFLGQLSDEGRRSLFDVRVPFMFGGFSDSSLNKKVDLKEGDLFKKINGTTLRYYDEYTPFLQKLKGQAVTTTILREGEEKEVSMTLDKDGFFGVRPGGSYNDYAEAGYIKIRVREYGFLESFGVGATKFWDELTGYGRQLKKIFSPSTGAYKGVGGFKAIFDIFPDTWSWETFWRITAFLSIMLAVLNLLPIPALDGGHVMFLLYEMISGRKPSDKFLEYAQIVGFILLLALIIFANGNDIYRAITK